ncbi:GntR family transcriptional regulator [Roseomonas sp. E05]|uniref:GntR family transcriptional regulator n=1 Tax=Roseomonas sp. E05 TaxID=3046310 RepID=UPI0024BB7025|nr:GntR family transcriptional regulator [Roseomonas sp. E05]MDJ0389073.1 GntR family transcriptional regulator [Roseomonas sp. E05]
MNSPDPSPEPPPLEEQAYRRLRQALVEGTFAPGDKLSLRRVATALGTSPMPVRAALRRLAAEQALDITASGTAIVPRLTRAAFLELGEVRAALEPLALRLAVPQLDAATLEALEQLLAGHAGTRTGGKPEEFLRVDREFLFTLYRRAEAPLLLGMIESLWLRRGPLFWEARWMLMSRPAEQAHRHAQILEALRAGEGARAAEELETEIRDATAFLLKEIRFAGDAGAGPEGLPLLRPNR